MKSILFGFTNTFVILIKPDYEYKTQQVTVKQYETSHRLKLFHGLSKELLHKTLN